MTNPTQTAAWSKLEELANTSKPMDMRAQFSQDPKRAQRYQLKNHYFSFNFSRQRVDDSILSTLVELANECDLKGWTNRMFSGEAINHTEQRAVLHTALRDRGSDPILLDGKDIKLDISAQIEKMRHFVNRVHNGAWRGYTGAAIKTVVNIGIGGSDLGPKMAYAAMRPYYVDGINVTFVSNLDSADFTANLSGVNPEETLFIIASKTFTTQETMRNAKTARNWLLKHAKQQGYGEEIIEKHFIALSTATDKVIKFGINPDNIFEFWDWVGGRYSLWSVIGLPLALGVGMLHFEALLDGAYAMDQHFRTTTFERNIPVMMALIGVWNRNFLSADTLAVIPYAYVLNKFPAYLQQLDMESNGKSIDRDGQEVNYGTGPIVWGSTGNNAQHAYFQHLHQSHTLVPIDFITTINNSYTIPGHQELVYSNMVGQSEAMMMGKTAEETKAEHTQKNLPKSLLPYRVFQGNTPSSILTLDHLTPFALGQLIAAYEHKVFVQGVIWNLNSFDQYGVELGKEISGGIYKELGSSERQHSPAASGAIDHFQDQYLDKIELPQ